MDTSAYRDSPYGGDGYRACSVRRDVEQGDFIREHSTNAEEFKASLWDYDLGRIAHYCEVSVEEFAEAAAALASFREMAVLLGADTVPKVRHDALVDAVMNLRLLNGTADGLGQGVYPLYFWC